MRGQKQEKCFEPRWAVIITLFIVIIMIFLLPEKVTRSPAWRPIVLGLIALVPIFAVELTGASTRWLRIERRALLFFFAAAEITVLVDMAFLIGEMIHRSESVTGVQLLSSSIGLWVANVLVFSILYWQLDRGGPEARLNHQGIKPDWSFPQYGVPQDVPAGWRPSFVDYLFLGFSTAMAFSTTDVLPLTSRAKLLMMMESGIALFIIVVIASRAINILGG